MTPKFYVNIKKSDSLKSIKFEGITKLYAQHDAVEANYNVNSELSIFGPRKITQNGKDKLTEILSNSNGNCLFVSSNIKELDVIPEITQIFRINAFSLYMNKLI